MENKMLSRSFLRSKVLKTIFRNFITQDVSSFVLCEELKKSINKTHELFIAVLSSLPRLTITHIEYLDYKVKRDGYNGIDQLLKFDKILQNPYLKALHDSNLSSVVTANRIKFALDEGDFAYQLFEVLKTREFFVEYMELEVYGDSDYKDFCTRLLKNSKYCTKMNSYVNDLSLYWYDDLDYCVYLAIKFLEDNTSDAILNTDFRTLVSITKESDEFSRELCNQVLTNKEAIDKIIVSKLQKWDYKRINKIDLAILSLGITELKYYITSPKNVVIDEYVELSKEYSSSDSSSFINAVLDNI